MAERCLPPRSRWDWVSSPPSLAPRWSAVESPETAGPSAVEAPGSGREGDGTESDPDVAQSLPPRGHRSPRQLALQVGASGYPILSLYCFDFPSFTAHTPFRPWPPVWIRASAFIRAVSFLKKSEGPGKSSYGDIQYALRLRIRKPFEARGGD